MNTDTLTRSARRSNWWLLLLATPYVGLLFPQIYSRATPTLWGFPFFYWYQFVWTIIMAPLTWLVYVRTKYVRTKNVRTEGPVSTQQGSN